VTAAASFAAISRGSSTIAAPVTTIAVTAITPFTLGGRFVPLRQRKQRLAGKPALAITLHAQALHFDHLPLFEDVSGMFHSGVVDLGNMKQCLIVGQDLYKGAKIDNALDRAFVDLTCFGLCNETFDDRQGSLHAFRI